MDDPTVVDLFVEDRGHEALLRPLIARVAREVGTEIRDRVRSARGGHGRAIDEFKLYQRLERSMHHVPASLLIVAIDGNCSTWTSKRSEIEQATETRRRGQLITACPDPHIERWFMADPDSFHKVVGWRPQVGRTKCERNHYKRLLAEAIGKGGHPPTLDGIEFASELAMEMDLYRAGRAAPSLKAFLDDIRAGLRRLRSGRLE